MARSGFLLYVPGLSSASASIGTFYVSAIDEGKWLFGTKYVCHMGGYWLHYANFSRDFQAPEKSYLPPKIKQNIFEIQGMCLFWIDLNVNFKCSSQIRHEAGKVLVRPIHTNREYYYIVLPGEKAYIDFDKLVKVWWHLNDCLLCAGDATCVEIPVIPLLPHISFLFWQHYA